MVYEMFLFFIGIFYLTIIVIFNAPAKEAISETCELFLKVVLPSVIPSYFFGNMLQAGSIFINRFKKLFFFFPLENGLVIYLISFICGFPTTVYLINDLIKSNQLTQDEANILIKSCGMTSPIFIFLIFNKGNFPIFFPLFLIISNLIYYFIIGIYYKFNYQKKPYIKTSYKFDFFNIINNIPNILLSIFTIMIIVNLLLTPFKTLNFNIYITDFLELTTGTNNILNYHLNIKLKAILLAFLITTGGIGIILQSLNALKKEMETSYISPISFVINRLICGIVTTTIFGLLLIFFY